MSGFINNVCSHKHTYVAPTMQIILLETQKLLANSLVDPNDPTGTGEDFPWESSTLKLFNLHE